MSTRRDRPARDPGAERFVLYVEGARDRHILRNWARLVSPQLARRLVAASVILGGRQPARAVAHLRELVAAGTRARGLCVLDRDTGQGAELPPSDGVELELFTWSRRHIESYLLVPDALRRGLRMRDRKGVLTRLLREEIPDPDDEGAWHRVDAKRLLDPRGPLARCAGRAVNPGHIARSMRVEELHPEVRALLARIGEGLGVGAAAVVSVHRTLPATR